MIFPSGQASLKDYAEAKLAGKVNMAARKKTSAKKSATAAKKRAPGKKPAARRKASPGAAARRSPQPKPSAVARSKPPLLKALYAEHRHIASVMKLFTDQLNAIAAGELVDTHVVYEIMDYMVAWPDRFHHPREDLIYGRVAELDESAADNVDSLQRDHDYMAKAGREVLRNIQLWRDGEIDGASTLR